MPRYLQSWIDQLRWQRLKPMEKLAGMLLDHLEGILNYCRTQVPLGVMEALNGNIKALLRRGRGYRDLDYLLLKAQRLVAYRKPLKMRATSDSRAEPKKPRSYTVSPEESIAHLEDAGASPFAHHGFPIRLCCLR